MINVDSIKQRSLIAIHLKYEKEIKKIEELIKNASNNGEFMIYIDPVKEIKMKWPTCSGILNVFTNMGFTGGYNKDIGKILISWFNDLDKINLLIDYDGENNSNIEKFKNIKEDE